jgi:hypothetical protein
MTNTKGMETTKQTAVDWLFIMLNNPHRDQEFANKLLQKAKEMEKERMIEFAREVLIEAYATFEGNVTTELTIEQYYEQTQGGDK